MRKKQIFLYWKKEYTKEYEDVLENKITCEWELMSLWAECPSCFEIVIQDKVSDWTLSKLNKLRQNLVNLLERNFLKHDNK